MLQSPTIQLTIFLYWQHYPEMCRIIGATKFTQEVYMGKHRNTFRLFEKYIKLSNPNKQMENP